MHILAINGVVEKASYSIGQLRKDNPNTSFPRNPTDELLAEWNVFPVKPTPGPSVDYTKNVKEGIPIKQGNDWVQVWEVTDATQEEIADRIDQKSRQVRSERDQKLAETDWIITKSIEVSVLNLSDWKAYRQALRDIPEQNGFPLNVSWPQKPV